MKKAILIWAAACILFVIAWNNKRCDHIYVAIEPAEVKISEPDWFANDNLMPVWPNWPSGKQEGKELVCIKCFNKIHQVIDYGERKEYKGAFLKLPDSLLRSSGILKSIPCDSIFSTGQAITLPIKTN